MLSPAKASASCSRSGSTNPPCAERHASRKSAISTRGDAEEAITLCAEPWNDRAAMLSLPLLRRLAPHLEARMRAGCGQVSCHRERGRLTTGKGCRSGRRRPKRLWVPAAGRPRSTRSSRLCRIAEERRPAKAEGDELSPALDVVDDQTRESPPPGQQSEICWCRERFRAPIDICYLRLTIRERQQRLGNVCQGLQFLHISQRGAPCRARRPLAKLWPASPARQPTAKPAGA